MLTRTLKSIFPSRSLCHAIRGTVWQTSAAPRVTRFLHSRSDTRRELIKLLGYPANNPAVEPPVKSGQDFQQKHAGAKTAGEGGAGAADAYALLLRSYHEAQQHLDLEQQRQGAAAIQASRMLSWLWSLDKSTWEDVLSREFLDVLCWHLEAEGKDDFVVQWLRLVNTTQSLPEDSLVTDTLEWPSRILASHVKAKLYWHKSQSPEPAINAVFALMKHEKNTVHIYNAAVILSKYLKNPFVPVYTGTAFEKCVQFAQIYYKSDLRHTEHSLHHPTDPSADAYLQAWRADPHAARFWRPQARASVASTHIRAAYILRLQGRNDDASWLAHHADALDQATWAFRHKKFTHFRHDPKLEKLRRTSPHLQQVEAAIRKERSRFSQKPAPIRTW